MKPIEPPAHVWSRIEYLRELPGEVWTQAGIAAVVIMAVAWFLYSALLRHWFFAWLTGGPRQLVLRRLDERKSEVCFEVTGGDPARYSNFEYILEVGTDCRHTTHTLDGREDDSYGEEHRCYRVSPASSNRFFITVALPANSLKPGAGHFSRVTWARLRVFHRWVPAFEALVNERGTFFFQNDILGLTPDDGNDSVEAALSEKIEVIPTRHSQSPLPNPALILLCLFLCTLPIVVPYLLLEGKFQRDRYVAESQMLDTQIAVLNDNLDLADNILKDLTPGSIAWYGGFENTVFEIDKDILQTWVQVRRDKASAAVAFRPRSGTLPDIVKAEYLVRTGNASAAIPLYTSYLTYEGEYWRLFPSLMTSVRFLLKNSGTTAASIFAHQCLARLPDWKRQNPTNEDFRLFLTFCQENPPPAEAK